MSTTEDRQGALEVYELGYLILPSLPEDKLPEVVSSIKEIISKEGGKEIDSEMPFLHPLAYSMSKEVGASKYVVNNAYIGWVKFEAPSSSVEALQDKVRKMNEVLRFLLIKAPRETTFTFAKMREAMEAKERAAAQELAESNDSEDIASEEVADVESKDVVE
jgi:ribosomal protein S6